MMKYLFIIFSFIVSSQGLRCEREGIFGLKTYKDCPGPYNSPEELFCCGDDDDPICCASPFNISEEDFEEIAKKLPSIIAAVAVVVIVIVVACIICCCCCPFCLLYKRRTRGIVHNPSQNLPTVQPVQQPYAATTPYPTQPFSAPQQGYPVPYPQQPQQQQQPVAAPYPMQSSAPYPTQPVDNPPPYSEKQMPYNPNY